MDLMSKNIYLAGSPYYVEDVLGFDLYERAKEGVLTHLLLNQPPMCDCHCRRCFMPDSRRNNCQNELSLDEYCKVIRDSANAGILCLEISGEGEPLLSECLRGIIQCAFECGLVTTLITNGHALTEEFVKYVFDRNVTLVISLFSLDSNQYEMDNNLPGSFAKTLENIKSAANVFKDGKEDIDGKTVYRIAIHTTAQTDNLDDLTSIRLFCENHEIFFSVAPLAPVGGGSELPDLALSSNDNILAQYKGHNSIILSRTSKREIGREVCGTCLYGLNIGYDGNVLFDAHAGYEVKGMLGNIRTDSIQEIIRRQRKFAPYLFSNIEGFCPVRDPKWPEFLQQFRNNPESYRQYV